MSVHVSPWLAALRFPDEESNHAVGVWTVYERYERKSLAMREVLRVRDVQPAAPKELPPVPVHSLPVPQRPARRTRTFGIRRSMEAPFDAGITPHALLVFGALHAALLLAWVFSDAPWTWRSASTLVAAGAALLLFGALRRRPSRRLVLCGLGVAFVSFARTVGVDWTWSTWVAFLLTAALAFVLARAAVPPAFSARCSRAWRELR